MLTARLTRRTDDDWSEEHRVTRGQHYGLAGPGTSAAAECPRCLAQPTWMRRREAKLLSNDHRL
jgi:hypothetical protein